MQTSHFLCAKFSPPRAEKKEKISWHLTPDTLPFSYEKIKFSIFKNNFFSSFLILILNLIFLIFYFYGFFGLFRLFSKKPKKKQISLRDGFLYWCYYWTQKKLLKRNKSSQKPDGQQEASAEGRSPPQNLEESLHSRLYLLVYPNNPWIVTPPLSTL